MLDSVRSSAVQELHRQEFEQLRNAYEAGVIVAAPAALHYCLEWGVAPPQWVVEAALHELCDLLKREKSKRRGRAAGAIARYRQDMVDFMRWNQVVVLREEQQRSTRLMETYPTCPSQGQARIYAEEAAKAEWLGHTLTRVYECASEGLEGTDAFGSPESIKRSCRAVDRNNRRPLDAFRYCQFHPLFVRMLGFEDDLGYSRCAKIAPWRPRSSPRGRRSGRSRGVAPDIVSRGTFGDRR